MLKLVVLGKTAGRLFICSSLNVKDYINVSMLNYSFENYIKTSFVRDYVKMFYVKGIFEYR